MTEHAARVERKNHRAKLKRLVIPARTSAGPLQAHVPVLKAHTFRPASAQVQAVYPVLHAGYLGRNEDIRLAKEQLNVQRQIQELQTILPADAVNTALQRRMSTPGPIPSQPKSAEEWVTAIRHRAEQISGKSLDSRQAASFTALQRQVAHTLVQAYRTDRQDADQRRDIYAAHLTTLQRHPGDVTPVSRSTSIATR